jgi:DNA-binding NarL/FixJ family response regulator
MRVAIADDGALFREGLAMLLGVTGHDVVASVADGNELLRALDSAGPIDVVVLDIRMPPGEAGGLVTARAVRERFPEVGLLLLSQYAETDYLVELLNITTESVGYRLKERIGSVTVLTDTVKRVAAGELVIEPALAERWVARSESRRDQRLASLTERETDVLRLMAEGCSNGSIAEGLSVSVKAVEKHTASIFGKLDLIDNGGTHHRRVLAVLAYLQAADPT